MDAPIIADSPATQQTSAAPIIADNPSSDTSGTTQQSPIDDYLLDAQRFQESGNSTDPFIQGPPVQTSDGRIVHAQGFYQFMPDTAKGLGINPYIEEDARKGAQTLDQQNYNKYGRIDLALAAYNWKPSALDAAVKKYGADNALAHAPKETQNYVNQIIARANAARSAANPPQETQPIVADSTPPAQQAPIIADQPSGLFGRIAQSYQQGTMQDDFANNVGGAATEFAKQTIPFAAQIGTEAAHLVNKTLVEPFTGNVETGAQIEAAGIQAANWVNKKLDDVLPDYLKQRLKDNYGAQVVDKLMSYPFEKLDEGTTAIGNDVAKSQGAPTGQAVKANLDLAIHMLLGGLMLKGGGMAGEAKGPAAFESGARLGQKIRTGTAPEAPTSEPNLADIQKTYQGTETPPPEVPPQAAAEEAPQQAPAPETPSSPETPAPTQAPEPEAPTQQPLSQSFAFEQDANNAAATLSQQHGIQFGTQAIDHPVNGTRYHLTAPSVPPERTFGFQGDAEAHAQALTDIYGKPFQAVQDRSGPLGDRWVVQGANMGDAGVGNGPMRFRQDSAPVDVAATASAPEKVETPPPAEAGPGEPVSSKPEQANAPGTLDSMLEAKPAQSITGPAVVNSTSAEHLTPEQAKAVANAEIAKREAAAKALLAKASKKRSKPLKGGKQAGSAPILNDAAQAILDGLEKGMTLLSKKGFKEGDWVKTMSGKMAKITKITGDEATDSQHFTLRDGETGQETVVPRQQIDYKYKPSGILHNPVGYDKPASPVTLPKSMKGSVSMEWANGLADKLRSIVHPDVEDVKVPEDGRQWTSQEVLDRMYHLYELSKASGRFVDKSGNHLADFEDFYRMIQDHVDHFGGFSEQALLDSKKYFDAFEKNLNPKENAWSNLPEWLRREGNAAMPFDQLMKSGILDDIGKKDDLGYGKSLLLPGQMLEHNNWATKGVQVYKWAIDSGKMITDMANRQFAKALQAQKDLLALPRKSMLNVANAFVDWDQNGKYHQELLDSGKLYPDMDMLTSKGMSPLEAKAYTKIADGYQMLFQYIKNAPRIPGYMPHMWHGAYKFDAGFHNAAGEFIKTDTIRTMSRKGAELRKAEFEKNGAVTTDIDEPSTFSKADLASALQEVANILHNKSKLSKVERDQMEKIYARVMSGTVFEDMERRGVGSYTGQHGTLDESLSLHDPLNLGRAFANRLYNNHMIHLYESYSRDVIFGWRNDKLLYSIAKPFLDDARLAQMPQLQKAVTDMLMKATGFSKKKMDWLDGAMRAALTYVGVDPAIPRQVLLAINEGARLKVINSANPGFALQHVLFGLYGPIALRKTHIDLELAGEKTGDYWNAVNTYVKSTAAGGTLLDKEAQAARDDYARDTLHTDMYEQSKSTGNAAWDWFKTGLLNSAVNKARMSTFDSHYVYYRELMPPRQAYEASKLAVDRVMQSFDPIYTPDIFNEGNTGRALRPFQQIKLMMMARWAGAVESTVRGYKTGDRALFLKSLQVPASLLALSVGTAGLRYGIPLTQDYDLVARAWNHINGGALPTWDEALTDWQVPAAVRQGLPSHLLGLDVSRTFEAPNFSGWGMAGPNLGGELAKLAWLEAKKEVSGLVNPDAIEQTFENILGTQLKGWRQDYIASMFGGKIQKYTTNDAGRTVASGDYIRTPKESALLELTGKHATSETEKQYQGQVSRDKEVRVKNLTSNLEQILLDKVMGKDTGYQTPSDIMKKIFDINPGYHYEDLAQKISKEAVNLNTTYVQRYLMQMEKLSISKNPSDNAAAGRMATQFKLIYKGYLPQQ